MKTTQIIRGLNILYRATKTRIERFVEIRQNLEALVLKSRLQQYRTVIKKSCKGAKNNK